MSLDTLQQPPSAVNANDRGDRQGAALRQDSQGEAPATGSGVAPMLGLAGGKTEDSRVSPLRVAIVEDDPLSRTLLVHMIALLGHEPYEPPAPEAVILAAAQGLIDLVLLDLNLDQDDGFSILSRLRSQERSDGVRRLPVVAVTGYVGEKDRQRCLSAGFDLHLGKPVRVEALRDAIAQCSAKGQAGRSPPSEAVVSDDAARVVATANRLRESRGGESWLGPTVLEKFAMRSVNRIEQLDAALQTARPAAIREAAEAVKTGADFMGAMRLANLTETLAHAAAGGDSTAARNTMRLIHAEHEAILALLLAPPPVVR